MFLFTSGVEIGGFKDLRFWNIIMPWNENVLKIFLKMQGIASYTKKFSSGSKDMAFVSDLSAFISW